MNDKLVNCEVRSVRDSLVNSAKFFFTSQILGSKAGELKEKYDTFQQVVAKKFEKKISIKLKFSTANETGADGPNYIIDELKANVFNQITSLT